MTDGFLSDEELIRLLEQKTPEELTLQELDYLKQRLADSAPLREALLGQLQMESYLAAALGRIQLSPQAIVAKAEEEHRSRGFGIVLVALLVGIPALGLTGAVLYNAVREPAVSATPAELAQRPAGETEKPAEAKTTDQSGSNATAEFSPEAPPDQDAGQTPSQAPPTDPAEPSTPTPAPAAAPASPPKPALPWEPILAEQGNLPSYQTVAFTRFDFDKRLPRKADLEPWFAATPGSNFRLHEVDTRRGRCGAIEGVARLQAPWTDDSVLRLALEHYDKLRLHFYRGQQGVTIVYYEDQSGRWVAYATTRTGNGVKPETLAVTATDDGRARRTELRMGGPMEIRWRDGELILSRGDIILLSAPLSGLPEDVFFEGRAAIQGIALARTSDNLPAPRQRPIAYDNDKPAELEWTLRKFDGGQPDDPQPTIERLPNGGIRLAGDKLKRAADISTPLPRAGIHEVVLELENVTPGTSVYFGREKGHIEHVLKFLKNRRNGRTFARVTWVSDEHEHEAETYDHKPEPCLDGQHCWLKLVYGCGNLRWWLSADGIHWAQIDHASEGVKGNLATLGLHVVANRPQTEITLRRLQLRELGALTSLAAEDIRNQAQAFPAATNLGDWTTQVLRSQPKGVDASEWRRACALKTLGVGTNNELANQLLEALLDSDAFRQLPVDRQLATLDDAMLLAWDLRDNGAMRIGIPHRYIDVGLQAYDQQGLPPWSTVRRASMSAPVVTWMQSPPPVEPAIRWEMIAAINDLPADQTLDITRQLRFFHQQQVSPLVDWAEAIAQRDATQRARAQGIAAMKEGWRHPLVEDLSKDAYNLLNEMQAVLASEAWEDAARLVTSIEAEAAPGLAPYSRDRNLLVSVPVAVRLMLADHPQLKSSLAERFSALARLRLNRAMAAGDWSEVELAAVQFSGTDEAAEAHRWLGDRALASGWFERALVEYERAQAILPSLSSDIAPRIRLAAAMLGRDVGQPITAPVTFGEMRLEPAQFEALVTEMKTRGNTGVAVSASVVPAALTPPPAASALAANQRSRFDGPTGDKPSEEVGRRTNQFRIPWPDRQLAVVKEGDLMYVSNRFQVAAYQLSDGQRRWTSEQPTGQMQRAQQFALIQMRPLVTSKHIYARLLYTENPLLVRLDKTNGKLLWTSKLSDREFFVSDPQVVRGQLGALSIQLQEGQEGLLRWNILDAETGEVQSQTDLLPLRNTWGARACCEVAQTDDALVAVLGGVTVSFDPLGRLRWVRKHIVIPADEDPTWIHQTYQPPLVVDDRLYLTQPGVRTVDCLDATTGSSHWSVTLPDVIGVVGCAGDLLVVRTQRDFRGLDRHTGEVRWRHPFENVFPWQMLSDASLLVATWEKVPSGDNQLRTRLTWLNPQTGEATATSVVPQLTDADPKLGPLLAHNDRLWTFFGRGQHEPTRDVVELVPSGSPEQPLADREWTAWQHAPPAIAAVATSQFPAWRLISAMPGDRTGLVADAHGETDVLGTRSQSGWPTTWARPISLPSDSHRRLRMRVGTDPAMQFKLQVHVGETLVQELEVKDEDYPDRWKQFEIDLSPAAGKEGWLTISAVHSGGPPSPFYWKTLELVD